MLEYQTIETSINIKLFVSSTALKGDNTQSILLCIETVERSYADENGITKFYKKLTMEIHLP